MDTRKQILVNSLISFLQDELNGTGLDKEKKESLEVAIQCLETTFEVDGANIGEKVELLPLIKLKPKVTEEQITEAEKCKTRGNDFMKNSQYNEAIDEYTKAIDLNPNNAVYFCNRAAAYTRIMKDIDAITDCNEAIKLDPTYGKAYGRLGIAYSNLNKLELALDAYQTALRYDPTNAMYETNLKVAQERIHANQDSTTPASDARQIPDNFSQFMNNPNIINMASQILSDQNFHSMMSGLINNMSGPAGDGMPAAVETMLQAGQALAQRVVNEDPEFYNRVARNVQTGGQGDGDANPSAPNDSTQKPSDKDQGSA
ncbi:unnamed protein product [Ceutorhynchus assimilis]|uniref:SGTA homodimerisation domain-containing protein n=1 Tax=Ceutorhynchus assimilis TaxID=467358 RepID=A0A9N9M9U8_9CUCU|nr:unnamed protein product [Ceutorhynchus assimilis]